MKKSGSRPEVQGFRPRFFHKLNLKCGNWPHIRKILEEKYGLKNYKEKYLSEENYDRIRAEVRRLADKYKLELEDVCGQR